MKHPFRKMIIALVLACAMLTPVYVILSNASVNAAREEAAKRNYDRMEGFNQLIDSLFEERDALLESYLKTLVGDFRMEVLALREHVEEGRYTGPETYEDGCVLQIVDGKPVYPKGWSPEILPLTEDYRMADTGIYSIPVEDPDDLNYGIYYKIADDTYAMKLIRGKDISEYIRRFLDPNATIRTMEAISGGHLVLFDKDGIESNSDEDDFVPKGATLESLGLDLTGDPWKAQTWIRDGEKWDYIHRDTDTGSYRVVFFYKTDGIRGIASGSSLVVLTVLALAAAGLITWHTAVQRMVRDMILTKIQYRRYHPSRIRWMTAAFCLVSSAAVFLTALYYIHMTSLRVESVSTADALEAIEDRLGSNDLRNVSLRIQEHETALKMMQNAARRLSGQPGLRTKAYLKEVSSLIKSDYIMLYDEDGKEILCDLDYVGFSLDSDEMAPFRRLLQGVESWTADPAADSVTGMTLYKIGVRVPIEGLDRYGALIAAMSAEQMARTDLQDDIDRLLRIITPAEALCFSVNRETGKIVNTSVEEMKEADAEAYGVSKALWRDNKTCGFTSGGKTWYGASRTIGQDVWFYCVSGDVLRIGNRDFALESAACALVYTLILALVMLWGYTRKNYDYYSTIGQEVVHRQTVEIVTADGRIKRTLDPTQRWGTLFYRWHLMDPWKKSKLVFEIVLTLAVLAAVLLMTGRGLENSLLGFILSGHWERGMNLFAVTAAVMTAGIALLFLLVLRLVTQVICMSVGTKGETIVRLLVNLTEYIVLFMVIYYVFVFFGIDTSGLLGAMAFISLAISLGSKDLVSDVLAGISIVFEGEYQVGDIVDIGGYKGKVMEIGARSTKLMGQGDNVKIINNRDVKNVLNMTRFNSWYAMELDIASTYPLDKLEKILQKELPEIGSRMEEIISGPVYKGVEAIGKGSFRITILAECREDNYRWVQRQLNREIRLLLDREEIPMA